MSRAKDVQTLPLASSSADRAFVTERAASPEGKDEHFQRGAGGSRRIGGEIEARRNFQ